MADRIATTAGAQPADGPRKFSTFGGVFTPSILTIFGVIMFMRAGFVVGQAGIRNALIILAISKAITLLTTFSISAIATNTEVKGGGAYFLISRTLGPEFGGSIGLALFMAQALSVPFYLLGFAEAVGTTFPALEPYFLHIAFASLIALFLVAFVGAGWAIKTQYAIMAILVLAIGAFLYGAYRHFDPEILAANWSSGYTGSRYSFWTIFAVYFPAVTGIMAGVNMSGDLKNPARALPLGTFAAVLVGAAAYVAQIVICGGATLRENLIQAPYESLLTNAFPSGLGAIVVAAGVLSATLSSALGSLLGAPRILQALGQDRILAPVKPFGKLSARGEPRRALWLVGAISVGVIYYATSREGGAAALNVIASMVSMLFLFTYGMTNLAAFVESYGSNPSFRPRFRLFHWSLALAGAGGCVAAAFLIDARATVGAAAAMMVLFAYVRRFVLTTSFGDARRGFVYRRIRDALFALAQLPVHSKNWRPTSLVLSGNPNSRLTLVKYALWMSSGRGIVVLVSMLIGKEESLTQRAEALTGLERFIAENRLRAFPQVIVTEDFDRGLNQLLQGATLGPLRPNVVVLGFPLDPGRSRDFVRHLRTAQLLGMSQIIIKDNGVPVVRRRRKKTIDVWFRGRENGSLMVILAYLLSLNPEWSNSDIRVLRMVRDPEAAQSAYEELHALIEGARMKAKVEVIGSMGPFRNTLKEHSADSTAVFLGFRIPPDEETEMFQARFSEILEGLPTTILVHSTGEADLLS